MSLNKPDVSIIVATDNRGVIAVDGNIPWKSPKDLQWFKQQTVGKTCLVGRKTFDTLPPQVVINRHLKKVTREEGQPILKPSEWVQWAREDDVVEKPFNYRLMDEIMVIGGAEIYEMFMPLVTRIYLTTVDIFVPASETRTIFRFPDWNEWEEIYKSKQDRDEKGCLLSDPSKLGLDLKFQIFQRKRSVNE
jgi:dihydrofolate reductase